MDKIFNPASGEAEEFINHQEILDTLQYAAEHKNDRELIENLLEKAAKCGGLTHREAAVLLECDVPDLVDRIFHLAKEIKQRFYGNRIVMFAPLYLSNYCVNGCVYCPYHAKNKTIRPPQAHPGGNQARGRSPAGYGSQASGARSRRRPAQ